MCQSRGESRLHTQRIQHRQKLQTMLPSNTSCNEAFNKTQYGAHAVLTAHDGAVSTPLLLAAAVIAASAKPSTTPKLTLPTPA